MFCVGSFLSKTTAPQEKIVYVVKIDRLFLSSSHKSDVLVASAGEPRAEGVWISTFAINPLGFSGIRS